MFTVELIKYYFSTDYSLNPSCTCYYSLVCPSLILPTLILSTIFSNLRDDCSFILFDASHLISE